MKHGLILKNSEPQRAKTSSQRWTLVLVISLLPCSIRQLNVPSPYMLLVIPNFLILVMSLNIEFQQLMWSNYYLTPA